VLVFSVVLVLFRYRRLIYRAFCCKWRRRRGRCLLDDELQMDESFRGIGA
jgi:hypothetical protein